MDSSYALGLWFIFLVSIIWAAASVLVQYLYQGLNFNSPFLLTYIGNSLFVLLIPCRLIWERRTYLSRYLCPRFLPSVAANALDNEQIIIPWKTPAEIRLENANSSEIDERTSINVGNDISSIERDVHGGSFPEGVEAMEVGEISHHSSSSRSVNHILSHVDHFNAALKISSLWFISNYFYNLSLAFTTITSSTVLASTGSVFTFIFSVFTSSEKFTTWKLLGVAMAVGGSIITSLQDASKSDENTDDIYQHQLWGDAIGLVSAVGYGGYSVLLRVLLPSDENRMSMQLFLGYIGLVNMIVLSPFLFWIIADMNMDSADGAPGGDQEGQGANPDYISTQKLTLFVFMCLVVKGLFDNVISDYLWARSIILTSPTVATVGLGLTIPLALLSDVFIMDRGDVLSFGSIIGAVLVLVGFIFVNLGEGVNAVDLVSSSALTQNNDFANSGFSIV